MSFDDRQLNLPKREEEILEFWERNMIFEKTLARTRRGRRFVFYEGPPYANGLPGIHHFEARVFKDIIIRYRTMRGFFVPRKAGWDTHGLPIEMEVEKQLGVRTKRDIEEKIGIARFVQAARENVFRYKAEWERFTRRIGYWLDLEHAYMTMSSDYIETLWWIIKEFWKKNLLYQDFKVVPWCTRCGTALSSHELAQGYETVQDRAVYVRFRVKATSKEWQNTSILSWTTTPWTLPGNVALAVNPKEDYVCVPDPEAKGHWLVLGRASFRQLLAKKFFPPEIVASSAGARADDKRLGVDRFTGKEMLGIEYEPLFRVQELTSPKAHRVYAADFVTMEEGTGVVHTAVMYGEDDYRLGKEVGLPTFHTVTETGHFIKTLGEWLGGRYVKDSKTEEKIIALLQRRGLLFAEERYEHDYPFCWRCETPLLYYAREGWWVKVSAQRKELIANNKKINWVPEHLKAGRFGEFLKEVRDWAFSRERYWGTPLPVWQCAKCKHQEVIGSLGELARRAPSSSNRYFAMRHGQAETQLLGITDDSEKKFHLTPAGRKEVERQARQLAQQKFDLIVTSPVLRTRETAKIVGQALGVPAVVDTRLREIHVGVFEGKPVSGYHRYYASRLEKFTKRPPKGESLNDLKKRVTALMQDLEQTYRTKRILLVSHEYPIWILWGASQGLSNEAIVRAKERRGKDFIKTASVLPILWRSLPRNTEGEVDLHRPFVDEFKLTCPKCQGAKSYGVQPRTSPRQAREARRGEMYRVTEVADVWFDSGAMPFAQGHWPFAQMQNSGTLLYPADYICEAVDQTRGWFYTLLAVSTLLGRGPSYKNVVSLGHVLDKNGQKMSKSKGNVVDPWAMIAKYGADAIRWYFYTVNAPGDPKRFDEQDILPKLRGALATLWNSFVFFDTYVDKLQSAQRPAPSAHVLDRWVAAKLDHLTADVTRRLGGYDIVGAARALDAFITEDFSNWYLRRSRRRFQHPANAREKDAAAATTAVVLMRVVELIAPFTPFLAEIIYQELKSKLGLTEESVHLRNWPSTKRPAAEQARPGASTAQSAKRLLDGMSEVRRLAAAALAERAKAGIKVRQPLARLKVKSLTLKVPELVTILADEVNAKEVVADSEIKGAVELDTALTLELREEGLARELVRNIQEMRRAAGFTPRDRVRLQLSGSAALEGLLRRWERFLRQEASVRALEFGGKRTFVVERELILDGRPLWVGIRKA